MDIKIRDWDSTKYHKYWETPSRQYLDRAERKILQRLVKTGDLIIDIGGGYGRLMELYKDKFIFGIIVDHSMSMLEDAKKTIDDNKIHNIQLVAADVNKLPFVDGIADQIFMIRILHHMENIPQVINNIYNILKTNGSFILEYQNSYNIYNRIRKLLGYKTCFNIKDPLIKLGDMYWNFHPEYIAQSLCSYFKINNMFGSGIFWNRNKLTQYLVHPELVDIICKRLFGRFSITHQIILDLERKNKNKDKNNIGNIYKLFMCPKCKSTFRLVNNKYLKCNYCEATYYMYNGIYDFR